MAKRKTTEVTFSIEVEPDETPVRGNACASGDDELDRETEDEITRRVNNGDVWAWACVRVVATCEGFRGESSYLGGCRYKGERDFSEPGGYFDDLCAEARADLETNIADARRRLALARQSQATSATASTPTSSSPPERKRQLRE